MVATPTKTLRFNEDVLTVLRSQVNWAEDGLSATMPPLDRKMYDQVSKAFGLMGGKWDRKAKATLFSTDPRLLVEGLVETGAMIVEKDGFFPTPPEVTRKLLSLMDPRPGDYNWLEPEAGDGAMIRVVLEDGLSRPERIYTVERNAERCKILRSLGVRVANGDFLKFRNSAMIPFHRILMNPPFEVHQDILHLRRAYELLAPGGILGAVMGEGAFYSSHQIARDFRRWFFPLGNDIALPAGSFKESGTMVPTRLVVMEKE